MQQNHVASLACSPPGCQGGEKELVFSLSLFIRVSVAMAWLASELLRGPRASPQMERPESVRLWSTCHRWAEGALSRSARAAVTKRRRPGG